MKSDSRRRREKAPVQASGIPVHCAFTRIAPAADLVPHPENANVHPPKQLDRYEKVVVGNGWRRAVVVSKLSGRIIKGHGAWAMAKRRGWDVPVEEQAYRTPAEERRDMLADNRLAELAETDDEKLAKLLAGLGEGEIELSGYDSSELERLLQENAVPDAEFPITAKLNERHDYVLIFCENESDFIFLQTLTGVRPERSYKKTGVGLGRAIPFKKFLQSIRENRHSLDVQGGKHDHAKAPAKRGRVRAEKPAR
jgi:hypothetical protein